MTPIPGHQLRILARMGLPIQPGSALPPDGHYDLLIDGIIGYRIKGAPYGRPEAMIRWANPSPRTRPVA